MATKLDLVNHLLQVVGERKVVSLNTGNPSVVQAEQALDGYNEDFQTKGWWFNTNRSMNLTHNNAGEILLPPSCIEFTLASHRLSYANTADKTRYTRRGNRVYDTWQNTFNIGHSMLCDMVVLLEIEDLPAVAQQYLKHYAAEQYCIDDDGDNIKVDKLRERTMLAYHRLKAAEMKALAVNALDSPAAQQMLYRTGQGYSNNLTLPGGRYR